MLVADGIGVQYLVHVISKGIWREACAAKPRFAIQARFCTTHRQPSLRNRTGRSLGTIAWRPENHEATPDHTVLNVIKKGIENIRLKLDDHEFSLFAKETEATLTQHIIDGRLEDTESVRCLRLAYIEEGLDGLDAKIRYLYYAKVTKRHLSKLDLTSQANLADVRYPTEWYPGARAMQREIHLHVGPTNSGKTYAALKRLEQSKSGIYAGPLRLLAHEVYDRLNDKGIKCNLITGDVQIIEGEDVLMNSCTVEMIPLDTEVEVAVVDEIQLVGDIDRGWAWTQALLGLKAKELHICGEARALPLIRELAAAMGDKLEIHQYERLNPLKTMFTSLRNDLKNLKKGDCIVAFSRIEIHRLRRIIENRTGRRAAVVYGGLPPETRARQAKLFNEPDNDFDFLVASDAIGMGLNLSIKRLIFASAIKFNGHKWESIPDHEIKQIAGRAGRYRVAGQTDKSHENNDDELEGHTGSQKVHGSISQNIGLVTTLYRGDLPRVTEAMQNAPEPVLSAGIFPPKSIILRFAAYFPEGTPFSHILLRLHEISVMHPRFHLCSLREQVEIADAIEPVRNLTIRDKIKFIASPAPMREVGLPAVVQAFARCVADGCGGALLDIAELDLDLLGETTTIDRIHLAKLEALHKALVLYLWLSYRFSEVFTSQAMAFHVKGMVEEKIDFALNALTAISPSKSHEAPYRKIGTEILERTSKQPPNTMGSQWERHKTGVKNSSSDELVPLSKALESSNVILAS